MKTRLTFLAITIGSMVSSHANTFSQTYFFGDSQSDSGFFKPITSQAVNPSGKFTTNVGDDKMWSEHVAAHYGTHATPNGNGQTGTNYAAGGALAGQDSSLNLAGMNIAIPSTATQIGNYLKSSGGKVDDKALYGVTSGAGNLLTLIPNAARAMQAYVQANPNASTTERGLALQAATTPTINQTAQETAQAIKQLKDAGAQYIIVPNVPDIGLSPSVRGTPAQPIASAITQSYATTLNTALQNTGANVIPLDMFTLMREVSASPSTYGFQNAHSAACKTSTTLSQNTLTCNQNHLVAENANQTHFFADSLHPTGGGHALIGDYAISVLESPKQISSITQQLNQQTLQQDQDTYRKINTLPENQNGLWVDSTTHKTSDFFGDGDSIPTLSIGASFGQQGRGQTGVHVHARQQENQWDNGGGYEVQTLGGGLFHRHDWGNLRLSAQLNYDHFKLDTDRRVKLGAATRVHQANTDGYRLGAGARLAYRFAPHERLQLTPYIGANAQRVQLGLLSENNSTLSTAMMFEKQKHESVNGEVGLQADWRFLPNTSLLGSVSHSHNFLDPEINVSARLKTVPTVKFNAPAAEANKNLTSATIGVQHMVNGSSLNFGISGYKGDHDTKGANVFMGVTYSF